MNTGPYMFIPLKLYRRSGGTETAVPADGNRQSGTGNRRHHAGWCEFTRLMPGQDHILLS